MKRFFDYNKNLKPVVKILQRNLTKPEKKLRFEFFKKFWEIEDDENSKIRIYKQRQIDNFIVDFYIPKLKMVIEVDWENHFNTDWIVYDEGRARILEWLGLRIIRFTNEEIMNNFDWVCRFLEKELGII